LKNSQSCQHSKPPQYSQYSQSSQHPLLTQDLLTQASSIQDSSTQDLSTEDPHKTFLLFLNSWLGEQKSLTLPSHLKSEDLSYWGKVQEQGGWSCSLVLFLFHCGISKPLLSDTFPQLLLKKQDQKKTKTYIQGLLLENWDYLSLEDQIFLSLDPLVRLGMKHHKDKISILESYWREWKNETPPPPLAKPSHLLEKGFKAGPEFKTLLEKAYKYQLIKKLDTLEKVFKYL
jgi:hypothetical protein